MPNVYTAPIYDNEQVTAQEMAARFARSLGFTIHQRDMDISVQPERREPGTYYAREIEKLEAERTRLLSLSDEQVAQGLEDEYNRIQEYNENQAERHYMMQDRYDAAIEVFRNWPTRTKSGQRVKQAALEQLEESRRFDCGGEPYKRELPKRHRAAEWHAGRIEDNLNQLERSRKYLREEQQRCDEVNQWVDDFYADVQLLDGIELNADG